MQQVCENLPNDPYTNVVIEKVMKHVQQSAPTELMLERKIK